LAKKKLGIIGIAIGIALIAVIGGNYAPDSLLEQAKKSAGGPKENEAYHIRLADSRLYQDGIFSDSFFVKNGTYEFRFVPNGDSPQILSISLKGESYSFSEDFELQGIAHETGISTYYTWTYLGENKVEVPQDETLQIIINPHGNTLGPVSVYLVK
jgi:hypothetical protein